MGGRKDINMGILIAIDGVDSSGKETQAALVFKKLKDAGKKVRLISFPAYDSESSSLVKMYLGGKFGTQPNDVNAYAAASFYAVDRYATYKGDWGKDYENGTIIIADRYVPSNIIHQAVKLEECGTYKDDTAKSEFIKWVEDYEYNLLGLPRPDAVVFLDMPHEKALELMKERANKIDNSDKKDIHERNTAYMRSCYDNAVYACDRCGWNHIMCVDENNNLKTIESINEEIMRIVNGKTD